MTPEEYERRPEVKEALKLVRKHRLSLITSGWASFKNRLMDLLGIHRDRFGTWDVPTEYIYAFKRVGRQPGERAWSKEDAFRQVVLPAIKAGRVSGRLGNAEGPVWHTDLVVNEQGIGLSIQPHWVDDDVWEVVMKPDVEGPKADHAMNVFSRGLGYAGEFDSPDEAKKAVEAAIEDTDARWNGWHQQSAEEAYGG